MGFLDLPGLQYFYNKYVKGLKSHAFRDPANNLTTTASGYALDARQGKALNDKVTQLNSALDCKQTTLSSGNSSYFNIYNSFDFVFANGMHLIKSRIYVSQDVSAGNGSMVLRGLTRTWKNEDKIACTTDAGDTIYLQGLVGENAIRLHEDEAQVKAGTVINVNYVIAPHFFN